MMWRSVCLCLVALVLEIRAQSLMSHIHMEGVNIELTLQASGNDVIGTFDQSISTGVPGGNIDITIHPMWLLYDSESKCNPSNIGGAIGSMTTTTTYPNDFQFNSASLADFEGKSLVIDASGKRICATIQKSGEYVTAVAYLRQEFFGVVFFRQHSNSGNTFIAITLDVTSSTSEAAWLITDSSDVDCANLGNPKLIKKFNPFRVDGTSCDLTDQTKCFVGDLSGKVGQVSLSSKIPNSYTDSNLPLSGVKSIVGKYIIITKSTSNSDSVLACAKISSYKGRSATTTFSHEGVHGSFHFSQTSPFDPTHVTVHLQGLQNIAGGYHVHNWPVPVQSVEDEALCAPSIVSGHLNPYGKLTTSDSYPAATTGTDDLYETGDLSAKYGLLEAMNEFGPTNFTDWNLPLFGMNSIIGRSIVIHRSDVSASRWVCSNVLLDGPSISAAAVFTGPIIGQIFFTQSLEFEETTVFSRLGYIDGRSPTSNHKWQISTEKVGLEMNCTSTGSLYNPSGIWEGNNQYASACTTMPFTCKTGDLSGSLGNINIGNYASADFMNKFFSTNSLLRLSGTESIIGRSVVILDSSGSQIMGCANIKMLHELKMSSHFKHANLDGDVVFSQKPGFGQIPTMVSTKALTGFNTNSHRLEIRSEPVMEGGNFCSELSDNIYNPLGFNTESGQTDDQHKVGDLSRRDSRDEWYDQNLPMKGPTSIMGHSLVVMNQNNVVACAPINFHIDNANVGYMLQAKLDFIGPVVGNIAISQIFYNDESLSDTSIRINLRNSDNSDTPNHNWHVHVSPIKGDATATTGRCSSTGGHYDPFKANIGNAATDYSTQCNKINPLRCELGDQAMKLGTYTLGSGKQVFNDVYLPLAGEYSVQGRSIVVHVENKGAPRFACADIIPVNGLIILVELTTPQNFDKRVAATVFASALSAEENNIVVELVSQSGKTSMLNIHFLGKDKNIMASHFKEILSNKAKKQSLGDYSSIEVVGKASHLMSSIVILFLSFIIGKLLT